jgi:hypothetical protein
MTLHKSNGKKFKDFHINEMEYTSPLAFQIGDKSKWFQNGVLSFLYP